MKTDIEIAQESKMKTIQEVAETIELTENDLDVYGKYKAKINFSAMERSKSREDGKLILVTSINPTPAGEGKSTVTIGLGDALNALNKQTMIALREPSLGPVMGIKGGATGGGLAQVVPMEDINLHFTGDMHAITTANNALSALIDNHIQQGNQLDLDPRRILWKRVLDLNDRSLRQVIVGLGGPIQGTPREDGFDITVASEIMAILCLATSIEDLKLRLSQIMVGFTYDRKPVCVGDLKIEGALALLLKEALQPNLVQTLFHTPTFVHGGPFANIAHGCNSILATKTALKLADYVVTEAGFGADLGGEKFLDIKVPALDKAPDTVVIVATIRALKMHGGVSKDLLQEEDTVALEKGFSNLQKHIESMQRYQVPVVVAINEFVTDTESEKNLLVQLCENLGVKVARTNVWGLGADGGKELAQLVLKAIEENTNTFAPLYAEQTPLLEKVEAVVKQIYGGESVVLSTKAEKQLAQLKQYGWDLLPVCMAKTQYSLADDASLIGRPRNFSIHIREFIPKLGAGFIVALTSDVMTMPGLPKKPAALNMDVTNDGKAIGLF
ncbi:formate--tetrahydrofolate ligase [Vagococcus entomophilus]|uniref:Formate--tetrahydrofolate ligase n=1 Tax=Vagococcus entomophilus TaxID=1160095 RepID=A0A430AJ72_9ENTE|nr:formate--tetrahydrofolate ligase [Vagococcus entomophilus]RSU08166.1 formate--tetrahydrofolate ligase [Vagococcus entomophilus]